MTVLQAEPPTWAACLTPPGAAAIATLAVRGPSAWPVVLKLFRPFAQSSAPLPTAPEPGRFWAGRFGEPGPASTADQIVLAVKATLPFPCLEIHCHGGAEVVRWMLEILEAEGVCICTWQELERQTLHDAAQTSTLIALAQAPTLRTAAILLDQYHGAFRRVIALVLAALDRGEIEQALRGLDGLIRFANLGRHLTHPWRVAVLGPPNVGKSSLINALAGYQRCVVAASPGTTRDVVTTLLALDGWPVELCDTAGLRDQAAPLEEQGIALAQRIAREADERLWVADASAPPTWPGAGLDRVRVVVNKVDLPAVWDLDQAAQAVHVSARTGEGLADLCTALAQWLVPNAPESGAAVPFSPMLAKMVEDAASSCRFGRIGAAREILKAASEMPGD